MADDRMTLLETLRKMSGDGDVDVLREGVRDEGRHRDDAPALADLEIGGIEPEIRRGGVDALAGSGRP